MARVGACWKREFRVERASRGLREVPLEGHRDELTLRGLAPRALGIEPLVQRSRHLDVQTDDIVVAHEHAFTGVEASDELPTLVALARDLVARLLFGEGLELAARRTG